MDDDLFGAALQDYQQGQRRHRLGICNRYGEKEVMPVSVYFRPAKKMPPLELLALEGCYGKVLDIGAGAGSHSLVLQQRKYNVTAMDISAGASAVMQQRGVKKIITADIFSFRRSKFDTLLFLMNGIGLAGTLDRLTFLLHKLKPLLRPGGQILLDSSDVAYLYKKKNLPQHYYGEVEYCYVYRGKQTPWFKWLYTDRETLARIALDCGFSTRILLEDRYGQYVARLTHIDTLH